MSKWWGGWAKKMHDSGQVRILFQFKDGNPDDPYTVWRENGQKSGEWIYKDGELVSPKFWSPVRLGASY